MPALYEVTKPPTHTSGNVAQHSSSAKRCGHGESLAFRVWSSAGTVNTE